MNEPSHVEMLDPFYGLKPLPARPRDRAERNVQASIGIDYVEALSNATRESTQARIERAVGSLDRQQLGALLVIACAAIPHDQPISPDLEWVLDLADRGEDQLPAAS